MSGSKYVYIVGGANLLIEEMFKKRDFNIVSVMEDADLVQFTGGSDVDPRLYNQNIHKTTHPSFTRDSDEVVAFNMAVANGIPMAGICRGGQFLNVMNGGSMWQDVNNHTRSHKAWLRDMADPIMVTSTHHQMMEPTDEGLILMRAAEATYKEKMATLAENTNFVQVRYYAPGQRGDIEAVFYEPTMSLCFQPHPEYEPCRECTETYFKFLNDYIFS